MPLRLTEAQQLYEAIRDPLLRPGLEAFFKDQQEQATDALLRAVRQSVRDTMREAAHAGRADAYEQAMNDLDRFAERQIKEATT